MADNVPLIRRQIDHLQRTSLDSDDDPSRAAGGRCRADAPFGDYYSIHCLAARDELIDQSNGSRYCVFMVKPPT